MEITRELIELGKSRNGGWSREQIELLGAEWPLEHGWILDIIGDEIPDWNVEQFLQLKDAHLKPPPQPKAIKNLYGKGRMKPSYHRITDLDAMMQYAIDKDE